MKNYEIQIKLGNEEWFSVAMSDDLKIAESICQRMAFKSFNKQESAVVNKQGEKVLWIQNV